MEKLRFVPSQRKAAVAIGLFAMGCAIQMAHAEFALNFQPVDSANRINTLVSCMAGMPAATSAATFEGSCVRMKSNADPDHTPFYMETAVDPSTGFGYYHVLLGDPSSDFAQEYYITYAGSQEWWPDFRTNASGGIYNGGRDAKPQNNFSGTFYAPLDPDATRTGNGSARPDRVYFRQTVKGTGFSQEVLKAGLFTKPKITQTVTDDEGTMTSAFVIDMSTLGYTGASALTNGGTVTNTLVFNDPANSGFLTNFDMSKNSQKSNVSAGKYSYTTGTGLGGSFGSYTYAQGSFDIYKVNWAAYLDKNDPNNFDYNNTIPNY